LWPANAKVDFTEEKEIRRPGYITRFLEHAIGRVWFIMVSQAVSRQTCSCHSFGRKIFAPCLMGFLSPGSKTCFRVHVGAMSESFSAPNP
jgi:hypothetical protein